MIKHIICDLWLKATRVRCTADEICKDGEYYWSLSYAVNGYEETTYNEYVEFMYPLAVETAKQVEKFSGVKINIWRYCYETICSLRVLGDPICIIHFVVLRADN